MGFEKGNKMSKGRPKGALNRSTEMIKLSIARAVDNTLNTLSTDLDKIRKDDPERAIQLALKLMEFTIPKLKSVDLKGTVDVNQKIQQISIHILDGAANTDKQNIQ